MISIVGCGPGALSHLTPAAQQAIDRAELLVGAPRLLELFPQLQAERIAVRANFAEALDRMAPHVGRKEIAVLVTGDPGVCSLAQPVIRRFGRENCRVIPGISSIQAAFAALGVDWMGARLLSVHAGKPAEDAAVFAGEGRIAVLTGTEVTNEWIVELAQRLADSHTAFVCQDLTLPEERVHRIAGSALTLASVPPRSVVVLLRKEIVT
jgi:precorrin-6y C5,15-methyltransferase (decarboxylating) CbiE subunit